MSDAMKYLTIAYDNELIKRLEVVATKLSQPGIRVTRSDAFRVAATRGIVELEKELKIKTAGA